MRVERRRVGWVFLLQWILATASGVTVGKYLGTLVGAFGFVAGFPVALAVSGLVVGTIVGIMQRLVLRQQQVDQVERWVLVNAVGGTLGAAVAGAVISILPINIIFYVGSTVAGVMTGTVVGIMQWFILRRWVYRARWWVLANTIGWTVGEVLLWAAIWAMGGGRVIVSGVVTGFLTLKGEVVILISGAVTGLITGIPLMWLLRHSSRE